MSLAPDEWSFEGFVLLDTSPPYECGSWAVGEHWLLTFFDFLNLLSSYRLRKSEQSLPFPSLNYVVLQALYAFSLCSIFSRLKKPSMFDWYIYLIEQPLCDIGHLCSVLLCVPCKLFSDLLGIQGWVLCSVCDVAQSSLSRCHSPCF